MTRFFDDDWMRLAAGAIGALMVGLVLAALIPGA